MRELTDDRAELVRLVERVMHLAAGSTQEEDDAVVMELQRRVRRAAVTDSFLSRADRGLEL